MVFRIFFFVIAAAICLFSYMNEAKAAVCAGLSCTVSDYDHTAFVKGGNALIIGDSGAVTYSDSGTYSKLGTSLLVASRLAPNTMMTFSLNTTGYLPASGEIRQLDTSSFFSGSSGSGSATRTVKATRTNVYSISGESNTPLILLASQLGENAASSATGYIINNSSVVADARITFKQLFDIDKFRGGTMVLNYDVSAVPLPAALPMFALGLVGIASVRSRRKACEAKA